MSATISVGVPGLLPSPTSLLVGYRLHRRNRVLQLRDAPQRAVCRHRIVLSRFHDEIALAVLETV